MTAERRGGGGRGATGLDGGEGDPSTSPQGVSLRKGKRGQRICRGRRRRPGARIGGRASPCDARGTGDCSVAPFSQTVVCRALTGRPLCWHRGIPNLHPCIRMPEVDGGKSAGVRAHGLGRPNPAAMPAAQGAPPSALGGEEQLAGPLPAGDEGGRVRQLRHARLVRARPPDHKHVGPGPGPGWGGGGAGVLWPGGGGPLFVRLTERACGRGRGGGSRIGGRRFELAVGVAFDRLGCRGRGRGGSGFHTGGRTATALASPAGHCPPRRGQR